MIVGHNYLSDCQFWHF